MLVLEDIKLTLAEAGREFRLQVPSLSVGQGDLCVVAGESGSGKTLLLEILGLTRKPDAGQYVLDDRAGKGRCDLLRAWNGSATALARLRGREFGFVLQSGGVIPFLTVRESVALPQKVTGREDPTFVDELLEGLRLSNVADVFPRQLSIGQRQRAAIARAISHRPSVLLADEPTSALDPELSHEVYAILCDLAKVTGTAVVIASHDRDAFSLQNARLFRTESFGTGSGAVSQVAEVNR